MRFIINEIPGDENILKNRTDTSTKISGKINKSGYLKESNINYNIKQLKIKHFSYKMNRNMQSNKVPSNG